MLTGSVDPELRYRAPAILSGFTVGTRTSDPNSAGSQFFVCLNYENTRTLDGRYTLFGKVTSGMEAVNKIAQAPLADDRSEKPREPQAIQRVQVMPVTKEHNPYAELMRAREKAAELRPAQPAK